MWIYRYTPETKHHNMTWVQPGEQAPKKAKVEFSARKVMIIVFWDWQGIFLVQYLPKGSTINADAHCGVPKQLRCEISRKRSGCFQNSANVFLIHDNACPHSANKTQTLLQTFSWTVYNHPSYSPGPCSEQLLPVPAPQDQLCGAEIWKRWWAKIGNQLFLYAFISFTFQG